MSMDPRFFDKDLNEMWEKQLMDTSTPGYETHGENIAVLQSMIDDQSESYKVILQQVDDQIDKMTKLQATVDRQAEEIARLKVSSVLSANTIDTYEDRIEEQQLIINGVNEKLTNKSFQYDCLKDELQGKIIELQYELAQMLDKNKELKNEMIDKCDSNERLQQLVLKSNNSYTELLRKSATKENEMTDLYKTMEAQQIVGQTQSKQIKRLLANINDISYEKLWLQNILWKSMFMPLMYKRKLFNERNSISCSETKENSLVPFGGDMADVWDFMVVPVRRDFLSFR